jgi:hypothetical protein
MDLIGIGICLLNLSDSKYGPVVGFYVNGKEYSDSIKFGNFLD